MLICFKPGLLFRGKFKLSSLQILHVVEASGSGTGRHVLDLTKGLIRCGHKIKIIYSPLRAEVSFTEGLNRIRGSAVEVFQMKMQKAPSLYDLTALIALKKVALRCGPFNILHGHSSKAGALVRLLPTSIPGTRIYTPHAFRTMDPELRPGLNLFFGLAERLLSLRCDRIITGSKQEFCAGLSLGIPKNKMSVVINGIEPPILPTRSEVRANLGLHEKDLVIGFVGRLEQQKAPERAIRALYALTNKQSKLVIIGAGSMEKTLQSLADELNLHARVLFVGQRDGQTTMPAFDLLIVTSRYESMGYVFLEANAANLPIVASPVGISREVILEGKTGCIVPNTDDVEPWARALNEVLKTNTLEKFKRNVANRKKKFSVNQMVDKTISIYNNLAC